MDAIEPVLYVLGIIGTILGVAQGIPWLLGAGPKSKGKCLYLYYDWEKKALIEETEYEFSFGYVVFLRKIFLMTTSSSTQCKLSFKSARGPRAALPGTCFIFKKAGFKDKVMLVKNDFFSEKEIDRVYVHTTTEENEFKYEKNLNVKFEKNGITVENNNDVEIRNYVIALPNNVRMDKLLVFGIISGIIVPEQTPHANTPLKIKVKKIEAKQGDTPFVLIIPYSI
jgi:hypothetical protein